MDEAAWGNATIMGLLKDTILSNLHSLKGIRQTVTMKFAGDCVMGIKGYAEE